MTPREIVEGVEKELGERFPYRAHKLLIGRINAAVLEVLEAAERALRMYGHHRNICASMTRPGQCSCGLDAALTAGPAAPASPKETIHE